MARDEERDDGPDDNEGLEDDKPAKKGEPKVKVDDDGTGVTVVAEHERRKPDRRERRERREVDHLKEQNAAIQRQLDEMRTVVLTRAAQPQQQQPQGEQQDPYAQEIDHIRREQEMIQTALRTGTVQDKDEIERVRQRYYSLDRRERDIERERVKRELRDEMRQTQQPRVGEYEEAALRNEFPDVIEHPQAMQYARGTYWQLVAEGKPATLNTSKEAMAKAAERFGLRSPSAPQVSAVEKQRFGAVSAQAGGKGNGGGMRLNSQQMRMALARWPQDDDNVAYAKMAQLLSTAKPDEDTTAPEY